MDPANLGNHLSLASLLGGWLTGWTDEWMNKIPEMLFSKMQSWITEGSRIVVRKLF